MRESGSAIRQHNIQGIQRLVVIISKHLKIGKAF